MGQRAGSCGLGPATSIRRCWKSGSGRLPPGEDLRTLTPTQMQRYFLRGTGPHQGLVRAMRPELAARVNFQPLNLLAPEWALPRAIRRHFCRNVAIYFDKATQRRILRRFVPLLKPGLMFAGHSRISAGSAGISTCVGRPCMG
ncbi:hypothetical protein M8494_06510 [Serratia ureilytica]